MTRPLSVGVAGLGTVGAGVLTLLRQNADLIAARAGRPIAVTAVAARDRTRNRGVALDGLRWYDAAVALASDPAVDVVVELIGGSNGPAKALVEAALAAGKPVVTANKALLALHGATLAEQAETAGVALAFEAAVAGGIPAIKGLREGLAANRIARVTGILNGTCNYILTCMLDQEDYTRAVVGDDPALRKPLPGFFTPGTPLYTEAGGDILKGPRDIEGAKRLLAEGGYNNEPVVCMISQDLAPHKAMGDVTAELLKRLGMNVEYVATDWGTVVGRRASKEPTSKGGWSMFHTWHSGADCASPAGYAAIRGNADKAWFGWPDSPGTEAGIADWYKATSLEQEKAAIARTNQAALEDVVYAPLGLFLAYQAWRTNVSGIVKGPAPFFWNVSKS
jgi:hypothetical protein